LDHGKRTKENEAKNQKKREEKKRHGRTECTVNALELHHNEGCHKKREKGHRVADF
jgi:hypothetical protein